MTEIDARDVLEKYIAVLNSGGKTLIRDGADLPYSKDTIRKVLKGAMIRTNDSETRERLRIAYLATADFQVLTNEERQAIAAMEEVDKLAAKEQADAILKYGPVQQAVAKRLVVENEILLQEIQASWNPN